MRMLFFKSFFMLFFRIIISAFAGLIIGLSHFSYLSAQNNDSHLLDSFVVKAAAVRGATESSSPLQRLAKDELVRIGVTDVGDALKRMSGVTVKDYGGVGGLKTVSVRGLGAQHTAVFYDGVAIGDCQNGQVDLGRYSVNNLSGIELTIGQTDDIYRTARMLAAAGIVSLETKGGGDGSRSGDWEIYARMASYETYKGSLNYNRDFGKGWGISAFGEYMMSQGEYSYEIENPTTVVSGTRKNSDIKEGRGEFNLSWRPSVGQILRMKMYLYGYERGLPGSVIVNNPITTDRLKGYNLFGQLFYENIFSSSLKTKFAFKHNVVYDRHREQLVASVSMNRYRQHETDFSCTAMWTPSFLKGVSLAWSEELFYNNLKTTNTHVAMPDEPSRFTLLSALSMRYCYRRFCATGTILHTFASESAPHGDVAPDRNRFSPSVALAFYPMDGENLCLRASYKNIFRLPTFNELYYREVGNYKLSPEKTEQYNCGIAYSLSPTKRCNELTFSADLYYGEVKDKIVAVPSVFMWKMNNVERVEILGVDVNMKSVWSFSTSSKFYFSSSYSYMKAVNRKKDSPLYGEQLVYTPLHSGSADAAVSVYGVDFGYSVLWSGKRYHTAQNISSNEMEPYADHSMWIARNWKIKDISLLTKAEIKNIGNKNYEIIRYYPMAGRNYAVTMIFTL